MKSDELRQIQSDLALAEAAVLVHRRALADFKKRLPELIVGECYRVPTARMPNTKLVTQVRDSARWLAQKCINEGPGSASDSVEARIVVMLEELCKRIEETQPKEP